MNSMRLSPIQNKVNSVIEMPGSKSYTNRALLLAALTKEKVVIKNPLISDDIEAMINCLNSLGIKTVLGKGQIEVVGSIYDVKDKEYQLDANLSGTTIRFILALCSIVPGTKILSGGESLCKRPIGELVEGLRQLGAEISYLNKEGYPPLKISSSKLNPGVTRLNGDISSQYFSALLMIAPIVGEVLVKVLGNQISKPYIDMTIDTMEKFGVRVENEEYEGYRVEKGQNYSLREYIVEGDYSSASYFFAVAALNKSEITLKNLNSQSKQADKRFLEVLEKMGAEVIFAENELTLRGHGVAPIEVDMENSPDTVQTLAVLAAFAKGVTKIYGVRSLRIKETERVMALENELNKMQVKTQSTEDSLTIYGGNPKGATINTYKDHRMAMSFAVAGSKLKGMKINEPEVVTKTFPEFWEKLEKMGVGVEER